MCHRSWKCISHSYSSLQSEERKWKGRTNLRKSRHKEGVLGQLCTSHLNSPFDPYHPAPSSHCAQCFHLYTEGPLHSWLHVLIPSCLCLSLPSKPSCLIFPALVFLGLLSLPTSTRWQCESLYIDSVQQSLCTDALLGPYARCQGGRDRKEIVPALEETAVLSGTQTSITRSDKCSHTGQFWQSDWRATRICLQLAAGYLHCWFSLGRKMQPWTLSHTHLIKHTINNVRRSWKKNSPSLALDVFKFILCLHRSTM